MKLIITLLMVVAVCIAVDPIGKNENNILYGWDGWDFEVYQENVGMFSVSESVNGADSVAIYFDVLSSTYDHYECYFWATLTDENLDATSTLSGHVNVYPAGDYASATAADTLNWVNLNSEGSVFGKIYYTITTGSADGYQLGSLVPGETWASPCVFG